jgi:uncharacterized membrane protein (UPF0127 family)
MKKEIVILVVMTSILVLVLSFLSENKKAEKPKTLKIGGVTLNIGVADTDIKRELGLSGKKSLAEDEGLLFIFDKEGSYGFWMKDMNFAIDMVWINKDKKITHIESNVLPETYPKIFNSPSPSLYVLETPAGFLLKNNVKIGDQVAF